MLTVKYGSTPDECGITLYENDTVVNELYLRGYDWQTNAPIWVITTPDFDKEFHFLSYEAYNIMNVYWWRLSGGTIDLADVETKVFKSIAWRVKILDIAARFTLPFMELFDV